VCAPEQCLSALSLGPVPKLPARAAAGLRKPKKRRARKTRAPAVALPKTGQSAGLVATLREWRLQEAKKKRVPAFRILTNRALVAIASARPQSPADLKNVAGVGPKLLKSYSASLLELCTRG